jgi:predicted permease
MTGNAHEFLLRLKGLFRRRRLDREMAEELAFHQEMMRAKLQRAGATETEAAMTARRQFGDSARWHERLRELWQFRTAENFARDVRFGVRMLARSPGFTVVALLTLALGVGANTTVFSMINGLLLRPLDVPHSDRLAVLSVDFGSDPAHYGYYLPEPLFRGLEGRHEVFSTVFAFSSTDLQVRGRDGNESVPGAYVSGGFFSGLEVAPLLGRTLTEADDQKGGNPAGLAAVISEPFWGSWFGRSPDIVGKKLTIDDHVFTIVGVMPKHFIGADPMQPPAIWVPLATEPVLDGERNMTAAGIHGWWLGTLGRLQPGATLDQANAQLAAATSAIFHEYAGDERWVEHRLETHAHFKAETGSGGYTDLRTEFRQPLMAVFAMCGGILLLACLNLTSLLVARGAARERELATRLALGAGRGRLTQQLLTESLLIALIGTALGLAVSPLVSQALGALLLSGRRGIHLDTSLDARVFAFAALTAVFSTLIIGLVPALRATSRDLNEQIKSGSHTTQAHERTRWLPRVLMACEVALALVLVVGAGLLAASLVRLYNSGAGFDPHGVMNVAFSMEKSGMDTNALRQFYQATNDGLRRVPGVRAVSFAQVVPFTHNNWDEGIAATGRDYKDLLMNNVGPDYFAAMGIPLLEGRDFRWNDTSSTQMKIILNEKAAKLLFPRGSAVGHIVNMNEGEEKPPLALEVVGVAGNAKYQDLRQEAPAAGYEAMMQGEEYSPSYYAVVRTRGDAGSVAEAARTLARQLATGIPPPETTSMMKVVDDSLSTERMMALLAVFFAVGALLVTAIGLYGTLAYATARRTSEIGIRMALGAGRAQVVRLVCVQNALVAVTGTAAGLVAALLAARALASFLYGTSVRDPWVLGGSVLALAVIACAASLLPAWRASRIDPMAAIRCE